MGHRDRVLATKTGFGAESGNPARRGAWRKNLARPHGLPAPIALQLEYSLVERHIEQEHVPPPASWDGDRPRRAASALQPTFLYAIYTDQGGPGPGRAHSSRDTATHCPYKRRSRPPY